MPNSAKMPKGNSNPFKHPENSLNPSRTSNWISIVGRIWCNDIQNNPSVPNVALSATSNQMTSKTSHSVSCSMPTTLRRGSLLGILRPTWIKITESEQRLSWLQDMERKKLVVRDIEAYGKSISAMLRSEELKIREEERSILIGLMKS